MVFAGERKRRLPKPKRLPAFDLNRQTSKSLQEFRYAFLGDTLFPLRQRENVGDLEGS